jgi:putative phage-type endonuclease
MLPGADVARREEWLAARRAGITASEIGVILGYSSYTSPFSLYWEKKGLLDDASPDTRMALGTYLEPFICDQFAERYPEYAVVQVGLSCRRDRMWQMATFDRVAIPADPASDPLLSDPVPVEAKTYSTYEGWGPEGSLTVPPAYWCQVQWQMDVLGASYGYLVCLFLLNQEIRVYELPRDDEDLEAMRSAALEFRRLLADDEYPPIDGSASTAATLRGLYDRSDAGEATLGPALVRSYYAAQRNYRLADRRKKLIDNRVRAALGEARFGRDRRGRKVVTRSSYKVGSHMVNAFAVDKLLASREADPYRKEQEDG